MTPALILGLAVLVGVVLRVSVVLAIPDMLPYGDEQLFYFGCLAWADGQPFPYFPFRPPLYPAFMLSVLKLFGPSADPIRLAQCLLEGVAILGVFRLTRRTLGGRTALCAAWLWALYPDFIFYSHSLWSETLALAVLVFALDALVAFGQGPSWRRALLTGVLWGLLTLVKPFALFLLPPMLGWVIWRTPRGQRVPATRQAVLSVLVGLLVVVPWSVYQSIRNDRFVYVCTTGQKNLRSGVNFAPPPQTDYGARWGRWHTRPHPDVPERDVGVAAFIANNPRLFLRRAAQKMSYLWSPNSFFVRHVYMGADPEGVNKYGDPREMSPPLRLGLVYLFMGSTALLCLCFVAGLFLGRHALLQGLTAVFCLGYMAMITLTPSLSRYRMPLMVFVIVWAAAFLAGRLETDTRRPAALTGLALSLAALLTLWWMRVPEILAAAW